MKKIVSATNLILLTLIAGLSVQCFYTLVAYSYSRPATVPEISPPTGSVKNGPMHPLIYYQPIAARDLFKTKDKTGKPAVPSESAEDLEMTDLNIRLWGTVTGQGQDNYAVIESITSDHRRTQQLYRQGEVVASATIKRILPDKVILDHNGTPQVLLLEVFRRAGMRPVRRTARFPAVMRRTISRKTIENAVGNVNQLLTQAKIVPAGRGGMRILAIKPRSLFRRMGLRNGDVITGVNKRKLRSMDDAMSLYQNLRNGGSVSIQLLRQGRRQTIEYRVR